MNCVQFSLLAIASSGALLAQTDYLKPAGIAPANGYSHVVVVSHPDKLIYIAGQVANDKDSKLVGKGDLKAQAEQVFKNLEAALTAAGASFANVIKLNTYIKGYQPSSLPAIREVRNKYVDSAHPPASTLVGVASLFQDDYLIEIEAVAALPDNKK